MMCRHDISIVLCAADMIYRSSCVLHARHVQLRMPSSAASEAVGFLFLWLLWRLGSVTLHHIMNAHQPTRPDIKRWASHFHQSRKRKKRVRKNRTKLPPPTPPHQSKQRPLLLKRSGLLRWGGVGCFLRFLVRPFSFFGNGEKFHVGE